jgi:hypothetical protein
LGLQAALAIREGLELARSGDRAAAQARIEAAITELRALAPGDADLAAHIRRLEQMREQLSRPIEVMEHNRMYSAHAHTLRSRGEKGGSRGGSSSGDVN